MIQPTIKHQESEEKTSSRQNYAFCMAPAAPLVKGHRWMLLVCEFKQRSAYFNG